VGEIDGIFGQLSTVATKAFQKDYGLDPDGIFGKDTEKAVKHAVAHGMPAKNEPKSFWDEIRYFAREEFRCKCGGKYCNGFPVEPAEKLVRLADAVREHFDAPAIVSSGVRCEAHNAHVGGVSGSRHKYGTAMDFCVRGLPASTVLPYVQSRPETNFAYAIDSEYIHMDVIV
jgi:hypothetical protein